MMKGVQLTGNGGPEKLSFRDDIPTPEINEEEVLIEVKACGMNNTDINTRVGWYSKSVAAATSNEGFSKIKTPGEGRVCLFLEFKAQIHVVWLLQLEMTQIKNS